MTRIFASLVLAAAIAAPVSAFAAQDIHKTTLFNAVVAKPQASSMVDTSPNALFNKLRDAVPSMPTITTPVAGDKHG